MITVTPTATASQPRPLRSTAAVLAGFVSVVALSLVTDQVLHVLRVYPPWGEPMWEPGLNLLALCYRTLYAIVGGYITAMLAPHSPMRHVKIVAVLGVIGGVAGVITALSVTGLGPLWYPVALAVTAFHTVWLGGRLYEARPRSATRGDEETTAQSSSR